MIRILIVDDKSENLYLLRALLVGHGYEVEEAGHGAEALVKARLKKPNLIISDLLMPVMDGYTLLRHWKADERLKHIPFIVYTATYTEPKDEQLALDLGADAFILKPTEPEPFLLRMREVLDLASRKEMLPAREPKDDTETLDRDYGNVLIRKLEEKTLQLQHANRELERELVERTAREAELKRLNHLYLILSGINHSITRIKTREELFSEVCRVATKHAAFKAVLIAWHDPKTQRIIPIARAGSCDKYIDGLVMYAGDRAEGCGPIGLCIREGKASIFNDFLNDPRSLPWRESAAGYNLHSVAATPIHIFGTVCGAFAVYASEANAFQDKEISLLEEVAGDISFALENMEREAQRHQTEQSHARLATAVEQAAEAIVITDTAANILYVNPAHERITGYPRQEAIGQKFWLLKSDTQNATFYRKMWDTLSRGEVWQGRISNKRKDGKPYEVDATISPVRDANGQIVNYVAVKHDVTHEAHLENQLRQAQKMEVIGRLAGGVAHDFNNILTAILGYSQLLSKALPKTERLYEYVEQIRGAGNRATDLTRQLLAFSRKQMLQPQVLNLNDLVDNLAKMLRRLIGEDIRLAESFDTALGHVKADPGQIEQVITNLVVNARDAMPHGGVLTIHTENVELAATHTAQHPDGAPGRYILLEVRDTGTGMTDEVKVHLFEPFFTTKEPGKGTGLGLASVYGIVRQSGGHISVSSELGRGTAFKIYLPRVEEAALDAATAAQEPHLPSGTETILLVEDDDVVRNVTRTILKSYGYTVLQAVNAQEAMQLAQQHQRAVRLLLTDLVMPGMNGAELAPLLVQLVPGIKVIYMSGYSDTLATPPQGLHGQTAFLQKPFSIETLIGKVREVLDAQPT